MAFFKYWVIKGQVFLQNVFYLLQKWGTLQGVKKS